MIGMAFLANSSKREECITEDEQHAGERKLDCSQSPVFPQDLRDRAPTLTVGHLGFKCTESSPG